MQAGGGTECKKLLTFLFQLRNFLLQRIDQFTDFMLGVAWRNVFRAISVEGFNLNHKRAFYACAIAGHFQSCNQCRIFRFMHDADTAPQL